MTQDAKMTRRQWFSLAGAAMGAAALAGCTKNETPAADDTPATPEKVKITVFDPTGAMEITQTYSPRLDTLEGKTIAFLTDAMWRYDASFPVIKDYLETKYHCTIINYDNFPMGTTALSDTKSGIPDMVKAAGADAAIVGNAG